MKSYTGCVGSLPVILAYAVMFGIGAALWWATHQMAWWTFALAFAGAWSAAEFGKGFVKAIRENRNK